MLNDEPKTRRKPDLSYLKDILNSAKEIKRISYTSGTKKKLKITDIIEDPATATTDEVIAKTPDTTVIGMGDLKQAEYEDQKGTTQPGFFEQKKPYKIQDLMDTPRDATKAPEYDYSKLDNTPILKKIYKERTKDPNNREPTYPLTEAIQTDDNRIIARDNETELLNQERALRNDYLNKIKSGEIALPEYVKQLPESEQLSYVGATYNNNPLFTAVNTLAEPLLHLSNLVTTGVNKVTGSDFKTFTPPNLTPENEDDKLITGGVEILTSLIPLGASIKGANLLFKGIKNPFVRNMLTSGVGFLINSQPALLDNLTQKKIDLKDYAIQSAKDLATGITFGVMPHSLPLKFKVPYQAIVPTMVPVIGDLLEGKEINGKEITEAFLSQMILSLAMDGALGKNVKVDEVRRKVKTELNKYAEEQQTPELVNNIIAGLLPPAAEKNSETISRVKPGETKKKSILDKLLRRDPGTKPTIEQITVPGDRSRIVVDEYGKAKLVEEKDAEDLLLSKSDVELQRDYGMTPEEISRAKENIDKPIYPGQEKAIEQDNKIEDTKTEKIKGVNITADPRAEVELKKEESRLDEDLKNKYGKEKIPEIVNPILVNTQSEKISERVNNLNDAIREHNKEFEPAPEVKPPAPDGRVEQLRIVNERINELMDESKTANKNEQRKISERVERLQEQRDILEKGMKEDGIDYSENITEKLKNDTAKPKNVTPKPKKEPEVANKVKKIEPDASVSLPTETKEVVKDTLKPESKLKDEKPEKNYSSTQVNIPEKETKQFKDYAKSIPDKDLYTDNSKAYDNYGRETEPHVTALYGIHTEDAKEIEKVLKNSGDVEITLGKTSLFENDNYDVLKVDVKSPELEEINKELRNKVKFTSDFDKYEPHLTIAYLKKGEGKKYAGDSRFEGKKIKISELQFSDTNRNKTAIDLSTKPKIEYRGKGKDIPKVPETKKPAVEPDIQQRKNLFEKMTLPQMETYIRDKVKEWGSRVDYFQSAEYKEFIKPIHDKLLTHESMRTRKDIEYEKERLKNKIITKESYDKAIKNIRDRGKNLYSNPLDPGAIKDLTTVGLYYFERGVRTFAGWSKRMINELGEKIKPHLDQIWMSTNNFTEMQYRSVDLPRATVHTTIKALKDNSYYKSAKSGNTEAADLLVKDLLKIEKVKDMSIRHGTDITLVPVRSLESQGRNKIPNSMSVMISHITGMKHNESIYQINKVLHTESGAVERMLNKPIFDGYVELFKNYILIDDVITSGSTIKELKNYIESKGGKVVDVISMGAGIYKNTGHYSGDISLKVETKISLEKKFDITELNKILYENGIAENYKGLSESEAKTILSFKNVDRIRDKIDETRLREVVDGEQREGEKIVSGAEYKKALLNLKKLPDKISSNPIGFYAAHSKNLIVVAKYFFERGVNTLAGWTKRMISELGDRVKPHLQKIWDEINTPKNVRLFKENNPDAELHTYGPSLNLKEDETFPQYQKRIAKQFGTVPTREEYNDAKKVYDYKLKKENASDLDKTKSELVDVLESMRETADKTKSSRPTKEEEIKKYNDRKEKARTTRNYIDKTIGKLPDIEEKVKNSNLNEYDTHERVIQQMNKEIFTDENFKKLDNEQKKRVVKAVKSYYKERNKNALGFDNKLGTEYKETLWHKAWKRSVLQANNVVAKMGDAGNEMAKRFKQMSDDERKHMGVPSAMVLDLAKLSKAEYRNLIEIRNWKRNVPTLTPKESKTKTGPAKDVTENKVNLPEYLNDNVRKADKLLDNYYNGVASEFEGRGFTTKNKNTGEEYLFTPRRNYEPRVISVELDKFGVSYDKLGRPIHNIHREKVIEHLVQTGQAKNGAKAAYLLDNYLAKSRINRAGNIEYSRTFDFPSEYYLQDPVEVMTKYATRIAKRLAFTDNFGRDGAIADNLIDEIRNNMHDYKFVQDLYRYETGNLNASERQVLEYVNIAKGFQAMTKFTPFTTLRNSFQGILGSSTRGNLKAGITGFINAFKPIIKREAYLSGALGDNIESIIKKSVGGDGNNLVGKATSKYLDIIGFTASDRFNRVISSAAGITFYEDMLKRIGKDSILKKRAVREFEKIGLDPKEILSRENPKFTQEERNLIMRTFSGDAQFNIKPHDLPLFWSSGVGKLVTQWKPFGYKMTQLIRDSIWKEAKAGNLLPMVTMLAAYGVAGESVNYVIDNIRGVLNFDPNKKDDSKSSFESAYNKTAYAQFKAGDVGGFVKRVIDDLAGLGAMTMMVDIIRSFGWGKSGAVGVVAGPALGEVTMTADDLLRPTGELFKGEEKDWMKNTLKGVYATATRNVPGAGTLRTFGINKAVRDMIFGDDDDSAKSEFKKTLNDDENKGFEEMNKLEKARDKAKKSALETRKPEDIKEYRNLSKELEILKKKNAIITKKKNLFDEKQKKINEQILKQNE